MASLLQLVRRLWNVQPLRYLLVAGCCTLFYLAVYWLLLQLGIHYFVALTLAQVAAISVAFPSYRRFVFEVKHGWKADALRFLSVWASGMVAGMVGTPALVELLGWDPFIAQCVSIVVVSVGSFFAHKFFSFRAPA